MMLKIWENVFPPYGLRRVPAALPEEAPGRGYKLESKIKNHSNHTQITFRIRGVLDQQKSNLIST